MKASAVASNRIYVTSTLSSAPHSHATFSLQFSSSVFHPTIRIRTRNYSKKTIGCSLERDEWSVNEGPAKALRRILDSSGIHQCPACFDALSAKLVQNAGFPLCFTSGFSISAARLGLPDTGLISYGEMVEQGQLITQAVSIPVIGDADNGYGNALNVKRTVKGYIRAGFAGIMLEDQANMLEGGGKTPILNPLELEDIGYKLVAYPLSLIGVSIRAMQDSLTAIRGGRIPPPGSMPSFEEIKDIVGFNAYYEEEKRYATGTDQKLSKRESTSPYSIQQGDQVDTEQTRQNPKDPIVEVITPDVYNKYGADSSRDPFTGIWSRTLRIKIIGRDGFEKLDLRIPAGFLDGITNIVPALGGVNIKELLDDAAEEVGGKLLLDFKDRMGDRIQVFLE